MAEYAWSNLTKLDGTKVPPGEEVSQSDFTETEEEWQAAYLDTGAVRELPYPDDIAADESPMSYYQRRALEISEGNFVAPIEVQRLVESGEDPEEAIAARREEERKAAAEAAKASEAETKATPAAPAAEEVKK
jgi:hypothetical protein